MYITENRASAPVLESKNPSCTPAEGFGTFVNTEGLCDDCALLYINRVKGVCVGGHLFSVTLVGWDE